MHTSTSCMCYIRDVLVYHITAIAINILHIYA